MSSMTRFKAAGTHLIISATLSAAVICLLMFGWYPLPFFWALGGAMLLTLIVGIDVVLGPLMTMILFNPAKSRRALTLDLTLIGIVQLSALGYGLYSGYVSRMAYAVFDGQTFQLIQASDIAGNFLKEVQLPQFKTVPLAGYRTAALSIPGDPKTQSDLTFFKALGVGPQAMPNLYVPLDTARDALRKAGIDETRLRSNHTELHARISKVLQQHNLTWAQASVVPFDVRTATYTAVVATESGQLLRVFKDDPH